MNRMISEQEHLRVLMAAGVPRRREGGVATIIYNLGRELEECGHEITYVFLDDLVEPGSTSPRFADLIFSLRLSKYIAENAVKFSIVNLHAPVGFPYGIRKNWSRARGLPPYVMTLHGLEERRLHVMRREVKKGRAWNFSLRNRLWHKFYHQPRFNLSIRTADGAHAYSRDVWSMLQLKYNLDSDRVAYIPSGVEQRFFVAREYSAGEELRLLYAGTWLDQRGIFYIRDAIRALGSKLPRLRMTFAGCGVPVDLIERFFGNELKKYIAVEPVVASERMQELYLEHDVFLFPSLMEGLPAVVLEAMATGMPVITTETCGMPDVMENEYNGLLIAPGSASAIEGAVLRLAASIELRRALGEAARETMKRYTWQKSGRQLESLFRHILAKESGAAEC